MSLEAACHQFIGCARASASSSSTFLESRSILVRRLVAASLDAVLCFLIGLCLIELINHAINARFPNPSVALFVQTIRGRIANGYQYEALLLLFAFWALGSVFESSRLRATPGKIALGLAVEYGPTGIWGVLRAQVRIILKLLYVCAPLYIAIVSGWFDWVVNYSMVAMPPGSSAFVALWLLFGLLVLPPALGLAHPRGKILYDTLSGTSVVVRPNAPRDAIVTNRERSVVIGVPVASTSTVLSRISRSIAAVALASSLMLVIAGGVGLYGSNRIYTDNLQIVTARLAEADTIRGGRSDQDLSPDEQRRLQEVGARTSDRAKPLYATLQVLTLSTLALASGLLAMLFSAINLAGRWAVVYQVIWPTAVYFAHVYRASAAWHADLAAEHYGHLQLAYVPMMLDLAVAGLAVSGVLSLALIVGAWASRRLSRTHA